MTSTTITQTPTTTTTSPFDGMGAGSGWPFPPPPPGRLARLSAIGAGAFFTAAALTGFVTEGYSPRREAISALAAADAPHAWLMILGFLAGGAGLVLAAADLWRRLPSLAARVGAVLVGAGGGSIVAAGVFRLDCSDRVATCRDFGEATGASSSYWAHQAVSMLAFLTLIAGAFFIARALRRSGRRGLGTAVRTAAALALVLLALLVVEPGFVTGSWGAFQRVFILVVLGWPAVTVSQLRARR